MATVQLKDMVGKEVLIYPGDTKSKQGTIAGVEDQGIMFKITKSQDSSYRVGSLHFISFSANLAFSQI